jgi:N-acetylmuramoyl-L-alanine amidase
VDGSVRVHHLIVHYTGMQSCELALNRLCDEAAGVSAHYLIDEDGSVYRMVPEDMRAWHAGTSFWDGKRDLNSISIGIELINPGHEYGYRPFPSEQLNSFTLLAQEIMDRHGIGPRNVLGHSDVAPGRKTDPGELFPWKDLAERGIGTWPHNVEILGGPPDLEASFRQLSAIGYAVPLSPDLGADILNPETGTADVIAAFQRRYRPAQIDGALDIETSGLIAAATI